MISVNIFLDCDERKELFADEVGECRKSMFLSLCSGILFGVHQENTRHFLSDEKRLSPQVFL